MIVDCHSHLFPEQWRDHGQMPADMFDIDGLVERQQSAGIDVTLVSDPHIWYGDLDLADIAQTRDYNDFVAQLSSRTGGALVGLGSVTPWRGEQHTHEAVRVVRELGLPGLALVTSDQGRYLDSVPDSFWETVKELDVPVFIHPGGSVVGQELMDSYRLGEVCGRPMDTTITLARFVLTGAFERHPNLRLLAAHAGGAICTIADRLDFGHELRDYAPLGPWGEVELAEPPSVYVRRLFLDTVTYGPLPLRLAMDTVGTGRVCLGTDSPPVPFPVQRNLEVLDKLDLDVGDRTKVLGQNAAALFKLRSEHEGVR